VEGQKNINCEIGKGGFHTLVILKRDGGKNQYRHVTFLNANDILISVPWPSEDLSVSNIREVVVDAMKEAMAATDAEKPTKPVVGDGK
jgi:hypothetical protein